MDNLLINKLGCADVYAARRLAGDQKPRLHIHLPRNNELLHIAAGQGTDLIRDFADFNLVFFHIFFDNLIGLSVIQERSLFHRVAPVHSRQEVVTDGKVGG